MHQISNSLSDITSRIVRACAEAGRAPGEVDLIAVSKTRTPDEVRTAFRAGAQHFGENYLQEATAKVEALSDLEITWHFIGAIQSNKTGQIARLFDWVHTVDREKVARRLSAARPAEGEPLNVLLQVNIDEEPQKAGVRPEALAQLLAAIAPLPRLRIRGLMAIPRPAQSGEDPAGPFVRHDTRSVSAAASSASPSSA